MAKYRKVDVRIWNDEKFRALSCDGKLIFMFLLTHPNMTSLGAMRATMSGLAEELGTLSKGFREGFGELFRKGFVERDETASFVSVKNFLKYNGPENPNVVKSWESSLDLIPECKLKTLVVQRAKECAESLGEHFAKGLPEPFRKGMPNQEQEQEQEQEPEPEQEQDTPKPPKAKSKSTDQKSIPVPDSLKTPEFNAAWIRWVTYRKEMGKKLTATGATETMKKFETWGVAKSIAAIDLTILKGVQGLLEPDSHTKPTVDLFAGQREASERRKNGESSFGL